MQGSPRLLKRATGLCPNLDARSRRGQFLHPLFRLLGPYLVALALVCLARGAAAEECGEAHSARTATVGRFRRQDSRYTGFQVRPAVASAMKIVRNGTFEASLAKHRSSAERHGRVERAPALPPKIRGTSRSALGLIGFTASTLGMTAALVRRRLLTVAESSVTAFD
jgi:hypothetical protein